MKINVEYDLDQLSYNQLRSMVLYLKSTNQIENLKSVNYHLRLVESKIGTPTTYYKFTEIKTKKTFWKKLFGNKL